MKAEPAKKLAAVNLSKLPEGNYPDPILPGLTFRPGKKRKPWTFRHRVGGDERRIILGYFLGDGIPGNMGLADARTAARKIAERVETGTPIEPPPAHPKSGKTVGDIIDAYEEMRIKKGERVKTLALAMRTVRSGLADYIALPARQLSKADGRAARDKIAKRAPMQANRFLAYLSPIWRWASSEDLVEVNFVPDILKTASEKKRERTLTHAEIKAIWNACDHVGTSRSAKNFGKLVRFLLVTGQRRDEGASLKFGHVLDAVWQQADNKSSRPHRLKLPKLALDLIGDGVAGDFVFTGDPGKKISGFSKHKKALDKAAGTGGWRIHDLRRTCARGMQDLGIDEMVIKGVLNHSLGGLSEVYLRSTLEPQKAAALQAWTDELERIVGKAKAA